MRMGKVKGKGMPLIFAFHRELARRGFHVTFLQAGSIKEKDLDTEYENLTVHQVRNWRLLGKKKPLTLYTVQIVFITFLVLRQLFHNMNHY